LKLKAVVLQTVGLQFQLFLEYSLFL